MQFEAGQLQRTELALGKLIGMQHNIHLHTDILHTNVHPVTLEQCIFNVGTQSSRPQACNACRSEHQIELQTCELGLFFLLCQAYGGL